jgi:Ca2+-binding RTX toxin-like protein
MFALLLSIMAAGLVLNLAMEDSDPAEDRDTGDGSGGDDGGGNGGGTDGGGGDGGDDTPSLPVATESADRLTLTETATGRFDALGGDDRISVEAETGERLESEDGPLSYYWATDDGAPRLTIDGGAGNDTLVLSGSGYDVTGGAGNDRIELGDAVEVMVFADGADTVVAGTGWAMVSLTEASSYMGADDTDLVRSSTSGTIAMGGGNDALIHSGSGQVDMGEGNDWVFGQEGASSVLGGAGNDTLIGTRSDQVFAPSATDLLSFYTSRDLDTLDGGAGDDRIGASHGDLVTTGAGADVVNVYLDAQPNLSGVEITDFDPAQDRLLISHDFFGRNGTLPDRDLVPFTGEVSVTETPEGDTIITGRDGQVLATLRGVTGVTVGVDLGDVSGLTDLAGNPTPIASYDVVLTRFYNVTS